MGRPRLPLPACYRPARGLFFAACLSLLLTGCAQTIPYVADVRIQEDMLIVKTCYLEHGGLSGAFGVIPVWIEGKEVAIDRNVETDLDCQVKELLLQKRDTLAQDRK